MALESIWRSVPPVDAPSQWPGWPHDAVPDPTAVSAWALCCIAL